MNGISEFCTSGNNFFFDRKLNSCNKSSAGFNDNSKNKIIFSMKNSFIFVSNLWNLH